MIRIAQLVLNHKNELCRRTKWRKDVRVNDNFKIHLNTILNKHWQ